MTTDFLLDRDAVEERSERTVKAPWSGYYFVNSGLGEHRSWSDMRRYGFVLCGGGNSARNGCSSRPSATRSSPYDKGNGYGVVTSAARPAAEFETPEGPLFDRRIDEPRFKRTGEPAEHAEHVVGIDWRRTVEITHAERFKGSFANQNIVCRLRDEATVDFLIAKLGVKRRT